MNDVVVIGLDPGFSNVGFAVVKLLPGGGEEPVRMGVLRTEKSTRKQKVLASDDNVRRALELNRTLRSLVDHDKVRALCAESMSYPRNAASAFKAALCWGVIISLAGSYDLPIVQASPQEIKKHMGVAGMVRGSTEKERVQAKAESKAAVRECLNRQHGQEKLERLLAEYPRGTWEHAYDALAVVATCSDGEVLKLARKMAA